VDVHEKLDELAALIENARAMPMSASCMINRADTLALIDEIRELLPEELRYAELLLADRESVIADGRQEAEKIIEAAKAERDRLVSQTSVARQAGSHADEVRQHALQEAATLRQEIDEYVDTKLANFEVVLEKTLTAVQRGRDKLRGRQDEDELGEHVRAQDTGEHDAVGEGAF
jgi:hypothetical protein